MLRRTFTKFGRVSAVKAAVALGSALDVARWHAGPLDDLKARRRVAPALGRHDTRAW